MGKKPQVEMVGMFKRESCCVLCEEVSEAPGDLGWVHQSSLQDPVYSDLVHFDGFCRLFLAKYSDFHIF